MFEIFEWVEGNKELASAISLVIGVFIWLYKLQISSLKEQIKLIEKKVENAELNSHGNFAKLIEERDKAHIAEVSILENKIAQLKNEYKNLSNIDQNDRLKESGKLDYKNRLNDRISELENELEKIVHSSGSLNLSYVTEQGNIGAFISRISFRDHLTVGDLPDYLSDYLKMNIDKKYLVSRNDYHKDHFSDKEKFEFQINSTRISTFFCFTDGKRMLLFDRPRSHKQEVINNKYDCFGSVTFENISLKVKIDIDNRSGFFDSEVKDIEFIPGFSYEDNVDPEFGKQTVIMFGFVVYLTELDLDKLMNLRNPELILVKVIGSNISKEVLTSKADLAREYLREKLLRDKV